MGPTYWSRRVFANVSAVHAWVFWCYTCSREPFPNKFAYYNADFRNLYNYPSLACLYIYTYTYVTFKENTNSMSPFSMSPWWNFFPSQEAIDRLHDEGDDGRSSASDDLPWANLGNFWAEFPGKISIERWSFDMTRLLSIAFQLLGSRKLKRI